MVGFRLRLRVFVSLAVLLLPGCWKMDDLGWRCNLALDPGVERVCGFARIFATNKGLRLSLLWAFRCLFGLQFVSPFIGIAIGRMISDGDVA